MKVENKFGWVAVLMFLLAWGFGLLFTREPFPWSEGVRIVLVYLVYFAVFTGILSLITYFLLRKARRDIGKVIGFSEEEMTDTLRIAYEVAKEAEMMGEHLSREEFVERVLAREKIEKG